MIERVLDVIGPVFAAAGIWLILGLAIAERSLLIGFVVPGDLVLALGGVFASRGELALGAVLAAGMTGMVAGDSAGYWLGRRFGMPLIRRMPFSDRLQRAARSAREHFERRGGVAVALGRFATSAGTLVPFAAGLGRMPYPRFMTFEVPSALVWGGVVVTIGYVFSENLELVETILSRFGWVLLGVIALVVAGRWAWRRWGPGRE